MKVVNRYKEEFTHYIGRGSIFGNEYSHKPGTLAKFLVKTREESIECFRRDALKNKELLKAIRNLPADAVLGCFCKPLPCHGDVIVELWNEMNSKKALKTK